MPQTIDELLVAVKVLAKKVSSHVRVLEQDRELKRHCKHESMVALAELSIIADGLDQLVEIAAREGK